MAHNKTPMEVATEWKEACNSHDADRVLALYAEDVVFKSPRVRTYAGEESGVTQGQARGSGLLAEDIRAPPEPEFCRQPRIRRSRQRRLGVSRGREPPRHRIHDR